MIGVFPEAVKMMIDKNNINQFIFTDYKRDLRKSMVSRLLSELRKDNNFKAPIHINQRGNKFRIIDGSHRVEALKRFLDSDEEREVEMNLMIYKDLSIEQERKLYDTLARTVNQSMNDFIKIHFDEVPIFQMIDNRFPIPISIYSTKDKLSFSALIKAWLSREKSMVDYFDKESFIDRAKSLVRGDYDDMRNFFTQYKTIFGEPATLSPYYKFGSLWIMISIYFRNREVVDKDKLWELFRKKLFGSILIFDCAKLRGQSIVDSRRIIVERLNHGWRSGNKLV